MDIEYLVTTCVVLFGFLLAAEPLGRRLKLPPSSVLVMLGAVLTFAVTAGLGFDTGLRASSFHDLVFFVFLPVLIFDAAIRIPLRELRSNLPLVLFLAIGGMLMTAGISAVMLYFGIGHPGGFPWLAALLAGALLAATDPVAVVAQFRSLGVPERMGVLVEGESLFNDATAIVLFSLVLSLTLMPSQAVSLGWAVAEFARTFVGGALTGLAFGWAGARLLRWSRDPLVGATVTLVAAYGSFLVAESVLHVSGVMASLLAGLCHARMLSDHEANDQVDFLWSALAHLANGSVFLLMGATITLAMFRERWLSMVIAIGAVLVARAAMVYGGLAAFNVVARERTSLADQTVLVWGGLRGAVTLGLALALPVELDYWFTIQSMAFGVVLFTLFVQAPTMPWLVRRLGLGRA